jgi:hypothetical protein
VEEVSMKRFFSHDPGLDGLVLHETAEEAKAAAQEYLDANEEVASSDGWPEETNQICWGKVIGTADLISSEPDPSGRFDTIDKYELVLNSDSPPLNKESFLKAITVPIPREVQVGSHVVVTKGQHLGRFGTVVDRDLRHVSVRFEDGSCLMRRIDEVMDYDLPHTFTWCGVDYQVDDKTAEQLTEMARKLKEGK